MYLGRVCLKGVRAALGAAFVVGFFFTFFAAGFLFMTFFGSRFGTYTNAGSQEIAALSVIMAAGITAIASSLLYSSRRFGRNLWQLLILLSASVLVSDSFVMFTGLSFPVFMPNSGLTALLIFASSLIGVGYGAYGFTESTSRQAAAPSAGPPPKAPRIMFWSILIGLIGGVFGLVALNLPLFAVYMEPPPPLLGQPIGYQVLPTCNFGPYSVCPPNVSNNIALASLDFVICFAIAFFVALVILRAFLPRLVSTSVWKRNALPAVLLVITLLVVSFAASGSVAQGASLTQPHWPTPSGVEVFPLNMTIYSGTASSPTLQGTAHMTLILTNYHWTDLNVSISVSVTGLNITQPISIYQCSSPVSCHTFSTVIVPPYTAFGLDSSTTALYFGNQIEKGAEYHFELNMIGEGLISQGNLTAI